MKQKNANFLQLLIFFFYNVHIDLTFVLSLNLSTVNTFKVIFHQFIGGP